MCGIVGEIRLDDRRPDASAVRRMCAALTHRGPDDDGFLDSGAASFGMRRLAIVDIDGGAQPIANEKGDVSVVFNGEIYNSPILRRGLVARGHTLASRSDTEVLVHLYEDLGSDMLGELRGMFAFAIWDYSKRAALLARDRLGIKPLYYMHDERRLLFGSELKAILRATDSTPGLDPAGLDAYLSHHYIPAPLTIFKGIRKLRPGHLLQVRDGRVSETRYWQALTPSVPRAVPEQESSAQLRELLEDAVEEHLMSDVPVGVFLSGGIDSSIIAALAARKLREPLRTYSIRFEDAGYDEGPFARAVAVHLGAHHTEQTVRMDAVGLLPRLVRIYDEPFGDPAALPGYYLAQTAARHVKVCLSGDGGDELFAGYNRYRRALSMRRLDAVPGPMRRAAAWFGSACVPQYLPGHHFLRKLGATAQVRYQMEFDGFDAAGRRGLVSSELSSAVTEDGSLFEPFMGNRAESMDPLTQLQLADLHEYLPECILAKVDRISMAHSLEVRVPFLDHRVVAQALGLPPALKLRGDRGKWILEEACRDLLPARIFERPKQGFRVPLREWFRGDLRTHAEQVLLSRRTADRGILRREPVRRLLEMHALGRRSFSDRIYSLLVFEYWCRAYLDGDSE
jgi:asparagine synthase (glutamine-hydrolysing)